MEILGNVSIFWHPDLFQSIVLDHLLVLDPFEHKVVHFVVLSLMLSEIELLLDIRLLPDNAVGIFARCSKLIVGVGDRDHLHDIS